MKLSEIAANLKLTFNGDGATEIMTLTLTGSGRAGDDHFCLGAKVCGGVAGERSVVCDCLKLLNWQSEARCATIVSANPPFDFARVLALFFPPYRPPAGIDPTARIAADVTLGEGASIGVYCVIGTGTVIGRNAVIHPHVTIYPNVTIGDDFTCHSQVSIREGVDDRKSRDAAQWGGDRRGRFRFRGA